MRKVLISKTLVSYRHNEPVLHDSFKLYPVSIVRPWQHGESKSTPYQKITIKEED